MSYMLCSPDRAACLQQVPARTVLHPQAAQLTLAPGLICSAASFSLSMEPCGAVLALLMTIASAILRMDVQVPQRHGFSSGSAG